MKITLIIDWRIRDHQPIVPEKIRSSTRDSITGLPIQANATDEIWTRKVFVPKDFKSFVFASFTTVAEEGF